MKCMAVGIAFLQFIVCIACVWISRITVPSSYVIDFNFCRPLILDCDFEFQTSDQGFVLKWYHNYHLIYQWIPPRKPNVFSIFKYHINTTFISSELDEFKYKAILLKPHHNLTGDWMCSVQTFHSADRKIKRMQVIVPEKGFELYHRDVSFYNGFIVICTVIHIHPEPELSIHINSDVNVISEMKSESDENGFFNKSIMARIDKYFIQSPSTINCMLKINQTDYSKKKSFIYYDYKFDKNHPNAISSKYQSGSERQRKINKLLIFVTAVLLTRD